MRCGSMQGNKIDDRLGTVSSVINIFVKFDPSKSQQQTPPFIMGKERHHHRFFFLSGVTVLLLAMTTLTHLLRDNFSFEIETRKPLCTTGNTSSSLDFDMPLCDGTESSSPEAVYGVEIPINENSTFARNQVIESIEHQPSTSSIVVNIRENSTCSRPVLMGRLSGPALITLHWTTQRSNSATVMMGTYHAPLPGRYFLEVIALFCDDFVSSTPWTSNFSFADICMEDPLDSRLTSANASRSFVDVRKQKDDSNKGPSSSSWPAPGYWIQQNSSRLDDDDVVPFLTRFQPQQCRRRNRFAARCKGPMDLGRFKVYEFVWKQNRSLLELDTPFQLCFVGASHSQVLARAFWGMAANNKTTSNLTVQLVYARYPDTVVAKAGALRLCDAVVIAVGQWPAGHPEGKPTLFASYYLQIQSMIRKLRDQYPSLPLYLRSINHNPMGDLINACPPKDWRSPPVVDAYNVILAHVCGEEGLCTFLDTNFLVGPVWDGAPDWCHLGGATGEAQVRYIVTEVVFSGTNMTNSSKTLGF